MEFHERSATCIRLGAPLIKITSLPLREQLSRLKSQVKNDDIKSLVEFERTMRASLEEIERGYRTKETL
jgi:V/A-type H+-transporting ATPase subunit A